MIDRMRPGGSKIVHSKRPQIWGSNLTPKGTPKGTPFLGISSPLGPLCGFHDAKWCFGGLRHQFGMQFDPSKHPKREVILVGFFPPWALLLIQLAPDAVLKKSRGRVGTELNFLDTSLRRCASHVCSSR